MTEEIQVPEGIADTIIGKITDLATWPFKEAITRYVKGNVSDWLKDATLNILDNAENKVVELIDNAAISYAGFRTTLEKDWDSYVDVLLYRLGFISVPQGEGPAMVEFNGIPLEASEQETESVFVTILIQLVVPVLLEVIGNWFAKK